MPSPRQTRPTWKAIATTLFASQASALGFDCNNIVDSGIHWDLAPLKGVHTVWHSYVQEPTIANWTFSLNLCGMIPQDKDLDEHHQCPKETRVCGLKYVKDEEKNETIFEEWVAIAGHFDMKTGSTFEVKPTRLKNLGDKEGVVLEMSGGSSPLQKKPGQQQIKQKAIISMICDREKTGWEPKPDPSASKSKKRDDDPEDAPEENVGSSLQFKSYEQETMRGDIFGVLKLEWETKYACEDASSVPPAGNGTSGYGFFTWLIIVLFIGIAAYVILGSWVNYTQYGARGLDLLPHADTLRDIPYMLRDAARKIQGSAGSRGGYSAV